MDVAKFLKNPPAGKDAPINKNAVADWESNVHYQKESARIIGIVEKCWERMGLEPSVWWHSGAGIQGLFKLDRVIGNDQASNLTMRLFMLLGGDPNVAKPSQVLRVPGGVNPKTSYGRKPTTSGPARFRRDIFGRDMSGDVIAVEELEAALDRAEGREGHTIQAGAPISDLDKDPRCARLTARAKCIILDGYIAGENPHHQKDPARRGAWLWDCCWEMAEAGMEPPDMVAILKDQRFGMARKAKRSMGMSNIPPVPRMSSSARAALDVLNEVLVGFPFDGNADGLVKCASRSVALSMLLSPHVAQTVDAVPLHLSLAPEARSGKSLIIQCAGIIATGKVPPAMSWTGREEEDEKRLTGAFDRGGPLLFIDNVKKGSKIFGDFLCAAITGAETSCRRLGHSGEWLVPTRMMVAASGNNVGVLGDLALRTIACTIDAKMPNPGERPFKVDLQDYCRTNRTRLVTACLTILRYADPDMKLTRMGGFEQWSRIVRSALIRLGEVDPLESAKDLREENPENAMLTLFGGAWDACPALRDGWHELSEVFSTAVMQGGMNDLADTLVIILPDERHRTAAGLGRFLATQNGKTFELDGRHVCFRKSLDRTTRRAGYELVAVDRVHSLEPRALAA